MLKKVSVKDLRIGMYVARVGGKWLDHGLWRNTFRLSSKEQLASVLASGIVECWIDTAKGTDAPQSETSAGVVTSDSNLPDLPVWSGEAEQQPVPLEVELANARRVCESARHAVERVFSDIRVGRTPALAATRPLVDEIVASVFRRPGALLAVARLKTKDDYTYMHSVSVCALMVSLASELGMERAVCAEAGLAGLLHDVGKALIPLEVLNKPGKLSEAEFSLVKKHPQDGHSMLLDCGMTDRAVLDVCLHHHEKVDGTGYPHRLDGANLPQMARMSAVCDVYDAVTADRPYKAAWEPSKALAEMASWPGHFDRSALAAFIRMMGIFPVGSLVRLNSGRLGVVMESRRGQLMSPLVKVFYSTKANEPIEPRLIDLSTTTTTDRIVQAESNAKWKFPFLDRFCTN